ncbi:MAG: hypothetical protein P4K83_04075 [Terracidiphilus sp.]|nr:hypothetical protein [Terracidiphilus sp.]
MSYSWFKYAPFFLIPFSAGANAQDQTKPEDVHIEIVVRPKIVEDAATLPHLDKHSFKIMQQGKKLPFKLEPSSSSGVRNLLFVSADALSDCSQGKLAASLSPLMSRGWKVRVADLSGKATAAFEKPGSWPAVCMQAASSSTVELFRELERLSGRRALVFESHRASDLLSEAITNTTMTDAIKKIPEIYLVDGGINAESKTPLFAVHQESSPSLGADSPRYVPCHGGAPNDLCNIVVTTTYKKSGFDQGVMHEKKVIDAVKDLLSSSVYYDIALQVPSSDKSTVRPIELSFHTGSDFSVSIEMYSVKHSGSENEDVRMAVTTPLVVHTRQ